MLSCAPIVPFPTRSPLRHLQIFICCYISRELPQRTLPKQRSETKVSKRRFPNEGPKATVPKRSFPSQRFRANAPKRSFQNGLKSIRKLGVLFHSRLVHVFMLVPMNTLWHLKHVGSICVKKLLTTISLLQHGVRSSLDYLGRFTRSHERIDEWHLFQFFVGKSMHRQVK